MKPFGISSRTEALVWLLDRAVDWPDGATNAVPPSLTGAKVVLTGGDGGAWAVQWWNTAKGKRVTEAQAVTSDGWLRLDPPRLPGGHCRAAEEEMKEAAESSATRRKTPGHRRRRRSGTGTSGCAC